VAEAALNAIKANIFNNLRAATCGHFIDARISFFACAGF
jgi:hypothetical protein